ncbi:LPXTG cell wall anchor domain-containing protein [Enterococcus hulanensis]|uniref:LPXTG cell wall anchor domain-containing protein n=1 Tax=Enterococcus hulanensis TaxID=2559929 RepID=UPI001A8D0A04|nr:LPXTG cell wall anchor domain-containing protein [Enterococcus hulanensis]MBO0458105.1 LPXTG cell wall anchor domain-containing protein [Enterococcus hulanensis]
MKTRFTILFILVCMIGSLHILTSVKIEASEVNVQLVIPEDVDDSETIFEIDKEVPTSKDSNKSIGNTIFPKTGEMRTKLSLIGIGATFISVSLFIFYRRKHLRS